MVKGEITPECECYSTLIYCLCQVSDFEAALKICKASKKTGLVPSVLTLELLVDGLASISKVNEASQIIAELKQKFPRNSPSGLNLEGRLTE